MKARILPFDEWHRLIGTEAQLLWPHLDPLDAEVLVVEDDGEIVGTWSMLRVVHAECLWIAPKYRGTFGVAKRLIRGMREIATRWGVKCVVTGSADPLVTDLILRVGGKPMPCESFVIPTVEPTRRDDVARGKAFHQQIEAAVPDNHPEDEEHDRQVGRALRKAIEDQRPSQAVDEYNAWARRSGYEPVTYLGMVEGRLCADIGSAVIEVDDGYGVHVRGA